MLFPVHTELCAKQGPWQQKADDVLEMPGQNMWKKIVKYKFGMGHILENPTKILKLTMGFHNNGSLWYSVQGIVLFILNTVPAQTCCQQ